MKLSEYRIFFFIFLSTLMISNTARSQSVSGVPGYVRIPIATFNKDGSMYFGTSFLPQKHLPYSSYKYDAIAIYASLTFLSFVEVDLRVTRQLDVPHGASHVVDRIPTLRLRILKEKKWVPAVAVGFHDVITSLESGGAHHFGSSYVVVTKNFHISAIHLNIGTTGGWGTSKFIWENQEFIGPFGGISLKSDKIAWMELLCDYDGSTINTGLRFVCFNHLYLTAATMNFDSFTGTISYCFNLIK